MAAAAMYPAAVSICKQFRVMEIVAFVLAKRQPARGNRPIAECPRRPCKGCYGFMIVS
jgi:hypothetical protein